ncbi:MAG: DUF5110 domain-containing protein, partial [Clostridia bacterium]|nr:DUF5110 domain-containing protein [Clostridia bacterium]
ELTARWLQLGVFSPILRLHSSNNPYITKEPWAYGPAAERAMKDALRLRHRLLPYLYTMNVRAHRELLPLVQPMYYSHPERDAAYAVKNQYWFGDQIIVTPITQKADPACGRGKVRAWLPEGVWTDLFTGTVYEGGQMIDLYRDLSSIPVLCKAGAILPMGEGEKMELTVCPGVDNAFTLYEDAGDGFGYRKGEYATTGMTLSYTPQRAVFTVDTPQGDPAYLKAKDYTVCFKGYARPREVLLNGKPMAVDYDAQTQSFTLAVGVAEGFTVELIGEDLQAKNEDRYEKMRRILRDSATGMTFKKNIDQVITTREQGISRPERFEEYLRRNASEPSEWNIIRAIMEYDQ